MAFVLLLGVAWPHNVPTGLWVSPVSAPRQIFFALLLTCFDLGESAASDFTQLPRIGWVYRIEGQVDGQAVVYVGSAADLKQRLTPRHRWGNLLQQESTKVSTLEVFAELDVRSSTKGTLLGARSEALRAAEQRALDRVRERVEADNRTRAPGGKETRVLNERNASADAARWEARHKVATSDRWRPLEGRIAGATTKALVALTLLDAYLLYHDMKTSQYVMAPYILGDEQGFFILQEKNLLLSTKYYKTYLEGAVKGKTLEITSEEFRGLREEAEALWGTVDWNGDFVPGLLNRKLPVLRDPVPMTL